MVNFRCILGIFGKIHGCTMQSILSLFWFIPKEILKNVRNDVFYVYSRTFSLIPRTHVKIYPEYIIFLNERELKWDNGVSLARGHCEHDISYILHALQQLGYQCVSRWAPQGVCSALFYPHKVGFLMHYLTDGRSSLAHWWSAVSIELNIPMIQLWMRYEFVRMTNLCFRITTSAYSDNFIFNHE